MPLTDASLSARRTRKLTVTAALVAAASLCAPALAETGSIPKPAPPRVVPKPKAPVQAVSEPKPQAAPKVTTPPDPVIPDPRNRVQPNFFRTFDASQKAIAARASAYLSSIQTLVGNFVQVGPDGGRTTGDFYLQKPGKIRFEYDAPSPIAIVADGSSVVVRDRRLATQDVYPLSQTPLRYLLSDRIDLIRDTNVIGISSDDLYATITVEETQPLIGSSRLMLMFGAKDGQLKQWTVTDPQGFDTTVAVYNLDTAKKLDPGLFKIDLTNYASPRN